MCETYPNLWYSIDNIELDTKRKNLNKKGILLQEELDRGFKNKETNNDTRSVRFAALRSEQQQ